ncbi:YbjN domain-containing protein [Cellulomonas hominis]
MGFFTKPDAASPTAPVATPLTHQRIVDALEAQGYTYGVDNDGDIGGYWDDHLFYFFRMGSDSEYLQVRGRWSRRVDPSRIDELARETNEWNAQKLWPKVYVRVEGDQLGVYSEHTVDYEKGLTDDQLDLHLACGVSTSLQFFAHLDEVFPAETATSKAEIDARRSTGS